MKHFIGTSQKAMAEVGILQLDLNHMGLYDFCKAVINWRDSKSFESGGIEYKWVSYQMIMNNMPCLNAQKKTVYRMVERLCDFGMLRRCPDNSKAGMVFLALGDVAIKYEEYLLLGSHGNDLASTLTSDKIVLHPGQNCPTPRTELSDNKKVDIISKDYSSDPLTPLQGETQEPLKPEKVRKSKTLLNREDATAFYKKELVDSLKDPSPLPKELVAAAARVKDKDGNPLGVRGPIVLAVAYSEVVAHMMEPSDMWPDGMWSFVLKKPGQLSFLQFCKLVLEYGMTRASVKDFLDQFQNNKYNRDNLYATFVNWKNREFKKPLQTGGNPPAPQQKQGLAQPPKITQ